MCTPPNCDTGISQGLKRAPSTLNRRSRTIRVLFRASCSGKPVVSIASKRTRYFLLSSKSSSMAFCENSSSSSFQRLSPKKEAKIGLVRSVYSQRSASKSFSAFRRLSTSDCDDAANTLEHRTHINNANRTQDRINRSLLFDLRSALHCTPSREFAPRRSAIRSKHLPPPPKQAPGHYRQEMLTERRIG